MRSMRATTAAARPYSRESKPSVTWLGTPMSGDCTKMAIDASSPASIHATMPTRLTGMPRSEARSAFSAEARSAMPILV